MAKTKQPIELVIARGKKHLTKEEIRSRRQAEIKPATDDIAPPRYLNATQKKHFVKLAGQLMKIKILGETDTDALARYVVAQTQYEAATKELRALMKDKPKQDTDQEAYLNLLDLWLSAQDNAARLQDRYFKQASSAARELGLTISSRCKLEVPQAAEEQPKVNKFAQFESKTGSA